MKKRKKGEIVLRKVNKRLLFIEAVIYRILTVLFEFIVLWVIFGEAGKAGATALGWNAVRIGWYYIYHYQFFRRFKIGIE